MNTLPPQPTPNSRALPLRQSCDRCHEQKVRCSPDQLVENGLEAVPDGSQPCQRCKRASAVCVYSVQQRPGRPAQSREVSTLASSRKRYRMTGKSVNEMPFSAPSPTMTSNEWISNNGATSVGFQLESLGAELSQSDGDGPYTAPLIEEWLAQYGSSNDHEFPMYVTQYPSIANSPNATDTNTGGYTVTDTVMFEEEERDPTEAHIQELSKLALGIYRASRSLGTSTKNPLLMSSPHLNEITETTGSLIGLLNRIAQTGTSPSVDLNSLVPGLRTEFDTGVMLLILACCERVLCAFEKVCLLIHQHLQVIEKSYNQQYSPERQRPSPSMTSARGAQVFSSSTTSQSIMIIELMVHLLSRLDRALIPLAGDSQILKDDLSPSSSTSSPVSTPVLLKSNNGIEDGLSSSYQVAIRVADLLKYHNDKVRAQMKAVKRLIRKSNQV